MKKITLLFSLLLPYIALQAQGTTDIDKLFQSLADKKGSTYVEMSEPMLKAILCRDGDVETAKGKALPCSYPSSFKNLSIHSISTPDIDMETFKKTATNNGFSILKRDNEPIKETYYYIKNLKSGQAEVLILRYSGYYGMQPNIIGSMPADAETLYSVITTTPTKYTPTGFGATYMYGNINVQKTDEYLARIMDGLKVERHMYDSKMPLRVATSSEQPISMNNIGIDELNRLTANYQQAINTYKIGKLKASTAGSNQNEYQKYIDILEQEVARFQARLNELKAATK